MAEESKSSPTSGGPFRLKIRGPRDFYGGLVLIALALFAFWASSDLPGQSGFTFGPGTAPRIFASLLIVVGGVIAVTGLFVDGPPLESYALRGPAHVILAIVAFALLIRGFSFQFFGITVRFPELGLVPATFIAFMLSVLGSPQTRWIESLIAAAAMTAFCVVLFVYLLQLPFPLWPNL